MFVEKYLILGIKYPKNEIFVDNFYPNNTKTEAYARLNIIQNNVPDIMYWSILPIVVNVTTKEARRLKLLRINKKIKRK